MKELDLKQVENIAGGATVTGPFALVGGLVGGMLGTVGGVYAYMSM